MGFVAMETANSRRTRVRMRRLPQAVPGRRAGRSVSGSRCGPSCGLSYFLPASLFACHVSIRKPVERKSQPASLSISFKKFGLNRNFPNLRLGHQELVRLSQGDLAFRDDSIRPQEEPAICPPSSQLVPPIGIQDSKELNRTCCLNGGTCMLGSFCACPHSFYGWNCEHDICKENCGSVPHDTRLSKKCSMCKCWHSQLRCFLQAFLPGCAGLVMDEHLMASRAPKLPPSACTTFMLAGICLSFFF
uniref:teratocarcinoma-derived growth factor 1-like n=1 Tax=Macaca mulatta TaxID=9544 RepID=UPI0010A2358D